MSLIAKSGIQVMTELRNVYCVPPAGTISTIERMGDEQRYDIYKSNTDVFYGPQNPFTAQLQTPSDIKSPQPYVYVSLLDSKAKIEFTIADSQANATNSIERDKFRMSAFLRGSRGENFVKNQTTYQKQNAFNETAVFDENSIVKNTERNSTTRHALDQSNLLGTAAIATANSATVAASKTNTGKIAGTATGDLPTYVKIHGSGNAGLLRNKTGYMAFSAFKKIWSNETMSEWDENTGTTWEYRPEYQATGSAYDIMYADKAQLLTIKAPAPLRGSSGSFYKDPKSEIGPLLASNIQVNKPDFQYTDNVATDARLAKTGGLAGLHTRMLEALSNNVEKNPTDYKSIERYSETKDGTVNENNNYNIIKAMEGMTDGPFINYLKHPIGAGVHTNITIDDRGFAKGRSKANPSGSPDKLNLLAPTSDFNKMFLNADIDSNQSADLIFFYFYDIINNIYIPFRATLTGIQDQNTPAWDDIKYMGRADTLYIYKGFSRNLSFNFKVYANSVEELMPMWKRINYLVGLTRPSKYTGRAEVTDVDTLAMNEYMGEDNRKTTTGRESGFIYPPMINFRIGDLYVDHPGVLTSVNVSIPEDANWETLRDEEYSYVYGSTSEKVVRKDAQSRQLPNIVDVAVQLNLIERRQSITNENHFGPMDADNGWQMKTVQDA